MAMSNLSGLISMAMIFEDPAILAPWMTARPYESKEKQYKKDQKKRIERKKSSYRKEIGQNDRDQYTYDCSKTKDGNGRVRLNLAGIPDGTKAGRNSASKKTGFSEVSLFIDLGAGNLSDDGVLAHSTAPVVVMKKLSTKKNGTT